MICYEIKAEPIVTEKRSTLMALHLSKNIINNSTDGGLQVAGNADMSTLQEQPVGLSAPLTNHSCSANKFFNLTKSKKIDLSCQTPRLKVTSASDSTGTEVAIGIGSVVAGKFTRSVVVGFPF